MQRDLFQYALQERVLCELTQWTSEADWRHAKVLDIGSRHGHRTNELYEKLAPLKIDSVRGIDTDVRGVEFAAKNMAHEKLDFSYIADFEDRFPLKFSCVFDWIFQVNPTLFHLNNQESALRNFLWCLKPGGRAVFAVPTKLPPDLTAVITKVLLHKSSRQLNQWMAEALDVKKKVWYGHPQADRVYAHIVERVGFQVHCTKLINFSYSFESKNEHKASLENFFYDALMWYQDDQRKTRLRQIHSSANRKIVKNGWTFQYLLILAARPDLSCSVCGQEVPTRLEDSLEPLINGSSAFLNHDDEEEKSLEDLTVKVIHNGTGENEDLENNEREIGKLDADNAEIDLSHAGEVHA